MDYKDMREAMTDICHRMWQCGWVAANDGNVSVRMPDGNILVTPTGISKDFITPDKLILVDLDGNIISANGDWRPSSEVKMHLRCYRERPDVNAVVHAHPPTATGYAAAGKSLDDYCLIETVVALGTVPVVPYATPSTQELPDAIAPFLADHDALLLANHGVLTVGCDLVTAYYRMETTEMFAKVCLTTYLLGGSQRLTPEQIEKLLDLRVNYYHVPGRHPGYQKIDLAARSKLIFGRPDREKEEEE